MNTDNKDEIFEIPHDFEKYITPAGAETYLRFGKRMPNIKVTEGIAESALSLFGNAYDYLSEVTGRETLGKNFGITFGVNFLGSGAVIEMDTDELGKLANNPGLSRYEKDLDQSSVIHEVTHMFEVEENLSMLIEMIYMMEKGHSYRINEIKEMLQKKELSPQHVKGLEDVSGWIGATSPGEMLDDIASGKLEVSILKKTFKEKVDNSVQEGL
jgi:hypothetical protein